MNQELMICCEGVLKNWELYICFLLGRLPVFELKKKDIANKKSNFFVKTSDNYSNEKAEFSKWSKQSII